MVKLGMETLTSDRELALDWTTKWLQLTDVFLSCTKPHRPPPSTRMEQRYQNLRRWFIDHESQFMPLWQTFCQPLPDNLRNVFSQFYKAENLFQLAQQLGFQDGDTWGPKENIVGRIRVVLIGMGTLLVGFVDRIDGETSGSG